MKKTILYLVISSLVLILILGCRVLKGERGVITQPSVTETPQPKQLKRLRGEDSCTVTAGCSKAILIKGNILTPNGALPMGQVLIGSDVINCSNGVTENPIEIESIDKVRILKG